MNALATHPARTSAGVPYFLSLKSNRSLFSSSPIFFAGDIVDTWCLANQLDTRSSQRLVLSRSFLWSQEVNRMAAA